MARATTAAGSTLVLLGLAAAACGGRAVPSACRRTVAATADSTPGCPPRMEASPTAESRAHTTVKPTRRGRRSPLPMAATRAPARRVRRPRASVAPSARARTRPCRKRAPPRLPPACRAGRSGPVHCVAHHRLHLSGHRRGRVRTVGDMRPLKAVRAPGPATQRRARRRGAVSWPSGGCASCIAARTSTARSMGAGSRLIADTIRSVYRQPEVADYVGASERTVRHRDDASTSTSS